MRGVSIFIASSIVEFQEARTELFEYLWTLNKLYKPRNVRLEWNSPENMSGEMRPDGSQTAFDEEIRACDFFFVIVGRDMGKYTRGEFETAWEQFQKTGKPKIFTYFLPPLGQIPKQSVLDFCARLEGLGHYYKSFGAMSEVKLEMQIELFRGIDFGTAVSSDREADAKRGQAAARELVQEQRDKIAALKKQSDPPEVIEQMMKVWEEFPELSHFYYIGKNAQIADAYEEICRLVQTYKVEPDALLDYLDFLLKRQLDDRAIEIGVWLENFYKLEDPGQVTLGKLKRRLGDCHYDSRGREGEQYYREAIEIYQRLASANPTVFEPDLAQTYHILARYLQSRNCKDEAEQYYWEELQIRQRLVSKNPAVFEPYVARIYYNVASLMRDIYNERKYVEMALTIYEKFPHCEKDAQACRNRLALMDELSTR